MRCPNCGRPIYCEKKATTDDDEVYRVYICRPCLKQKEKQYLFVSEERLSDMEVPEEINIKNVTTNKGALYLMQIAEERRTNED